MQQPQSATRKAASGRIQAFEYPADPHAPPPPVWGGWAASEEAAAELSGASPGERGAVEARQRAEHDQRLTEETRRSFEAGREKGIQEGRQAEREAQAASRAEAERERRRQAAEMIENFAQERDRYLQAVEHEVVKLALGVSARILRREAQMDPLLLSGAVRVALGQLSASTEARLRVPLAELDLWTEAIALMPNLAVRPAVVAGEGMRLGDCVIETGLGTVDLGLRAQLSEIERGFFDRIGGAGAGSPVTGPRDGAGAGQESRP